MTLTDMRTEKPNILMIVIDCLGTKVLNDLKKEKIPNISKLINEGVYFTNAIAVSTTTSPSFASILTGLYPARHGIRQLRGKKLRKNVVTLPQILANNGYFTIAQVTGPLLKILGLDKGFHVYEYRDKEKTVYSDWWRETFKKIKELQEPWFFLLHLWELHGHPTVPSEYNSFRYGLCKYVRALVALDRKLGELLSILSDNTLIVLLGDHGEVYPSHSKKTWLRYSADRCLKKCLKIILTRLFRVSSVKNLEKSSVKLGHGFSVKDILVKIPLILKHRNLPKGLKIDIQVSHVDIFPTLLDFLGIKYELEYSLDGRSLLPIIRGEDFSWRPVICEACGAQLKREEYELAVRTPRYKFILKPYVRGDKGKLYDLRKDPQEKRNIIDKKKEVAKILRKYLEVNYLPYYYGISDLREKIKAIKQGKMGN